MAYTRTCPTCSKEFRTTNRKQVHCSHTCTTDPRKKKTFICAWCGKEFVTWAYRNQRFCSRQCTSEYAARQPKPNLRKPQNFVTVCCENCGKEVIVHKCMVTIRNRRFCSRKCQAEVFSTERVGANHPRWKGAPKSNRGPNWSIQRKKALQRDNHRCQICGMKKGKTKRRISVHHILPYKQCNGYLEANDLHNLITLCQRCHNLVEWHGLPCPRPLF